MEERYYANATEKNRSQKVVLEGREKEPYLIVDAFGAGYHGIHFLLHTNAWDRDRVQKV